MSELISENWRELTPAYGRDYKTQREAQQAFLNGQDWVIQPEDTYCSVRDFKVGTKVILRYGRLLKTTVVQVH